MAIRSIKIRTLIGRVRPRSVLGVVLGCAANISFVLAQDGAPQPGPSGAQLEEVLVTAERRESKLQDTPIAVSVIDGGQIQRENLVNLSEIAAKAPSITFNQVNHSESFISIRGTTIGNDAAGIDQGVSVFIDEVPTTGFGDDSPDLYDLQSVEVLRGPQGTLFGRNVTGGAVLIRTLPPSFTASGRATVTYGSDNLMEVQGYDTGPLVENVLAGKFAVDVRRRDDFLSNIALHDKTYGENLGSLRGQLLWTPSSAVRVLFGGDYLDDTSAGKAQWLVGNFQPSLFPTLSYSPDDTNQGSNARTDKKVGGLLTHVDWQLPFATLTSITGYRKVDEHVHFSTSGDPFNSIISDPVTHDNQISEEARITSPAGQRLAWVGGIFYLHADRAYLQTVTYDAAPGTRLNALAQFGVPSLARFLSPYVNQANQRVAVDSKAAFGEATFEMTTGLKMTVGARYSSESKSGHTEISNTSVQNPALSSGPYSKTWTAFTPKALLSYEPVPDVMLYVSATKGFESGGYDTNGTTNAELASAYNPEYVWSYEGGIKTSLLDKRLQINLAIYDAEYKDLQTRNFDPISGNIIAGNAAKARVRGGELEIEMLPVEWLTLGLSYSYTDAKYRSYLVPNAPPDPPTDNSGHTIPFTPRNAANVRAETHFGAPGGAGKIRIGADVTYRSAIQFNDANSTPNFILAKSAYHGVLNTHVAWSSDDDRADVTVWAKNLTDKRAIINNADLSNFFDTVGEFSKGGYVSIDNWNDPRTVGISLTRRF
jgi:iron complex outermembrane receptor protein